MAKNKDCDWKLFEFSVEELEMILGSGGHHDTNLTELECQEEGDNHV